MNYRKSGLTPAKKKFAEVYAKTDNASKAVRIAFKGNKLTKYSIRDKGRTLLTNPHVNAEIENQKHRMELIASKAVDKIEGLIDSENENIATQNSWKAYEQVHGKPLGKNISLTAVTNLEDALESLQRE